MKHQILTMIRQFQRKPVTNIINIIGLALGMTIVIILASYCYSELTTDFHHLKGNQIYMVMGHREKTSSIIHAIHTPGILKEHIDEKVPQVKTTVRIAKTWNPPVLQFDNREPITSHLIFADPDFFSLFDYSIVAGDLSEALKNPMSLVLVKSEAEKLFGTDQAVGKTVKINNHHLLTVTSIVNDPQNNSCLTFKAIAPVSSMNDLQPEEEQFISWWRLNFQTFVLIENKEQVADAQNAINNLFPVNPYNNECTRAELLPFKNIYFSKIGNDYIRSGDKQKTTILLLVAILVLLIAVVNCVNISSTHRLEKLKQFGVQKIIGASRFDIFKNIIIEAMITYIISLACALSFATSISSFIRNYTAINFSNNLFTSFSFIGISVFGVIVLSIISSIYPAYRLSASHPMNNLKKVLSTKDYKSSTSTTLVVFQFVIAFVLIAFTILVQKQVKFGSKNLGFNKENIIAIQITDQLRNKRDVLKKALLEQAAVEKISFSRFYPGKRLSSWQATLSINGEEKIITFDNFHADPDFFDLMGIKLKAGRFFTSNVGIEKNKTLVNEAFLREYGISNPIGATFYDGEFEIIGVFEDFHFKPVNEPIGPLAIISREWASVCLVKLSTNDFNTIHALVENTRKICSELSPAFPVEINFMDVAIENMYKIEVQFRRTFSLFAGCALFLCCLGIFALSFFSCQRRTKEIGIRKVIGAQSNQIFMLLNKQMIKWVAIAYIIACPLSWYVMQRWLQNFAYQTELTWWIYALSGVLVFVIALFTVSWQAIRAAMANPVESLRYE